MILLKKKTRRLFIDGVVQKRSVISIGDKNQGLDFLVSFFSDIRPSRLNGRASAGKNLQLSAEAMLQHPILLRNFQHALISQLVSADLSPAFTESGIPLSRGFWQEFFGRIRHKMLPPLKRENDFLYVIDRVFFRSSDYQWVEDIPHPIWVNFFENVGLRFQVDDARIASQLIQSLRILSFQIAQLGLEKEVLQFLPAEDEQANPFVEQSYRIHSLEKIMFDSGASEGQLAAISSELIQIMERCFSCIAFIRDGHAQLGTSLHQTYTLMILQNKLDRMVILVELLDSSQQFETIRLVDFFKMLIRNENRKNSLREFLSDCLGYLAYQIAEHKGTKGNKYITTSRVEYARMIVSAMKGGLIISFIGIIKNLLANLAMPIFWHGFAASVNYSIGFVAIDETDSTLATKQPAFTASALASSLDKRKNTYQPNLYNLALTVAKVSRSQIASFIGNLVVVFPCAYILAWLYDLVTGNKIVSGEAAASLLRSQHPWQSLSLLYACNTGFFLFLSGIIAGYVENKIHYSHIAERLDAHPILRISVSEHRLHRLAHYFEKHAGSIIGNVALGFMLGMSGVVTHIFGIPFDIRHITISAANVSIAVYGLGFAQTNMMYLLVIFLGVLGIGLINFLVSFFLAFVVALKSRGVRLKDYPEFFGILTRYFFRKPMDFVLPPRRVASAV